MRMTPIYKIAPIGTFILYHGGYGVMAQPFCSTETRYTLLSPSQVPENAMVRILVGKGNRRMGNRRLEARQLVTKQQAERIRLRW